MGMRSESSKGQPLLTMAIRFTYEGLPYSILTHVYRNDVEETGVATDFEVAESILSGRLNLDSTKCTIVEITTQAPSLI